MRRTAVIGDALASRRASARSDTTWCRPRLTNLLWAADVVAWAYGAGGHYRRAIAELVSVHRVP
jgi:hypothetical protein